MSHKDAYVAIKSLNSHLLLRSYLVGYSLTAADLSVVDSLALKAEVVQEFSEIVRWYDHIKFLIEQKTPTINLVPITLSNVSKSSIGPESSQKTDSSSKNKKESTSDNANKSDKPSKTKTPPVSSTPPASTSASEPSPALLDIRVGLVVRAWDHPESEKLVCEEIDVGEATNRQIASGIRPFYQSSEVQGRRVLVLANLKDRSLAGFKSQGMVLAASSPDHSQVRLLEAPAEAAPGDRVVYPALGEGQGEGQGEGEPATASQMAKKKIWEKLCTEFRTDASGTVCFRSQPVVVGGKTCRADLTEAAVG
eukprot:CAMPEP_0182422976 /NCGR_PEP_ID=MMETSP1167-20130531/8848_1 /TAXON_ID=2988 /ORGANISM="Mallomonas Sp, Strain CCMP3275" /LENGTH=307 /DNA_ID=CAMNT_0024601519 /DNA_START=248 /DNA_END=1171 /DNA_ORIENTATION=+